MSPLEYLHLQLRLEGKEIVNGNLLRQVEVVPDEDMPLMLIASLSSGELIVYYDEALSPDLRVRLEEQTLSLNFPSVDSLIDILRSQNPELEIGYFKTYTFSSRFKDNNIHEAVRYSKADPKVQAFGFGGFMEQVYGVEQNGQIVSACVSVRENNFCGEAWVFTDVQYRHQGFAQRVVSAWARDLILRDKVPFYSHKMDNIASMQLAKRLGLEPAFEVIAISRTNV